MESMRKVAEVVGQFRHFIFDDLQRGPCGYRQIRRLLHLIVDIKRQADHPLVHVVVQFPCDTASFIILRGKASVIHTEEVICI